MKQQENHSELFGKNNKSALELFQLAMKVTKGSVFENNFKTNDASGTKELYYHMGYTDEELPQTITEVTRLIHPDDIAGVMEAFAKHIANPSEPYYTEFRMQSKAGQWIWVEGTGLITQRDNQGQPILLTGISKDITRRRLETDRIRESQEMLAKAEILSATGSWKVDYQTNLCLWSENKYRLLGMEPATFAPCIENYLQCIHPDDRQEFENLRNAFHRSFGKEFETRHRIIRQNDGQVRLIQKKWISNRNEEGNLLVTYGVIQDITPAE